MRWVLLVMLLLLSCTSQPYDIIIRQATIIDGSGKARYSIELAIKHGQIVKIAKKIKGYGLNEINTQKKIVSPGFITCCPGPVGQFCTMVLYQV